MSQSFRKHLERNSGLQRQRRMRMPQPVQTDHRHVSPLSDRCKPQSQGLRMDHRAIDFTEYEGGLHPDPRPLGCLNVTPLTQYAYGLGVQANRPNGRLGLRRSDRRRVTVYAGRLTNGNPLRREVDILPTQCTQLTTPKPGRQRKEPARPEPVRKYIV